MPNSARVQNWNFGCQAVSIVPDLRFLAAKVPGLAILVCRTSTSNYSRMNTGKTVDLFTMTLWISLMSLGPSSLTGHWHCNIDLGFNHFPYFQSGGGKISPLLTGSLSFDFRCRCRFDHLVSFLLNMILIVFCFTIASFRLKKAVILFLFVKPAPVIHIYNNNFLTRKCLRHRFWVFILKEDYNITTSFLSSPKSFCYL